MKMNGHQVNDALFSYIAQNIGTDPYKLLLKTEHNLSFDKSFAIVQIECRQKTKNKIPELLTHDRFLFAKSICAEQCTHEQVAKFHASLFNADDQVLDMTMGLGVDDHYIAQRVKSLTTIEIDRDIAEIGKHNFSVLNHHVQVIEDDCTHYIKSLDTQQHYDAIFIDPARRGDGNKRLYGLEDCTPNVLHLLPNLKVHAKRLYIKASPMLDVTQSMRELGDALTDVWAVSVKNECKELFFKLDFEQSASPVNLHALNFGENRQEFSCNTETIFPNIMGNATPQIGQFLYEPNAGIMKLGCHNALAHRFAAMPIAPNSHLYLSEIFMNDFPGRKFRIADVIAFKDKELKQLAKNHKRLNIATRNFKLTADALKKRLKAQDGGNDYLFATTLSSGEPVLILANKP